MLRRNNRTSERTVKLRMKLDKETHTEENEGVKFFFRPTLVKVLIAIALFIFPSIIGPHVGYAILLYPRLVDYILILPIDIPSKIILSPIFGISSNIIDFIGYYIFACLFLYFVNRLKRKKNTRVMA